MNRNPSRGLPSGTISLSLASLSYLSFTALSESRRNRSDALTNSRLAKKEALLKAKRYKNVEAVQPNPSAPSLSASAPPQAFESETTETLQKALTTFKMHQADEKTVKKPELYHTLESVLILLGRQDMPPIDQVIQMGFLPHIVRLMSIYSFPQLVFRAEWALTNITSKVHGVKPVVDSGAVENLEKNLFHNDPDVRLQSIWCLGNIAGGPRGYRDLLSSRTKLVRGLIENLKTPHDNEMLHQVGWAISALCRGKPKFYQVQSLVSPLVDALTELDAKSSDMDHCRVDIVWALAYIGELNDDYLNKQNEGMAALIQHNVGPLLVNIVARAPKKSLLVPAVRAISNLTIGSDEQTAYITNAGYLPHALALLNHCNVSAKLSDCPGDHIFAHGTSTNTR